MKLNKHIVLIALVAGALATGNLLQAQDASKDSTNSAPQQRLQGVIHPASPEEIAQKLGLSEEQTTKFKTALQDQRKQMMALRDDTSLSQQDRRAKMKGIREATNDKMKEILTADQYQKYLKLQPGPRNRPGAGAPAAPTQSADGSTQK